MVRERGGAGDAWGKQSGREREREGWRNTADQSDIQEDESEKKELQGGREREEIERACRIIEPYMVTVKYEAI